MLAGTAVARETSGPDYGIYAYTGREWDPEVNLYYYRARYYDPKIGRFMSEDPIGFKSADMNFYGYVYNNPTSLLDPTGLQGISPWGAAFYCERHRQRNLFNRCPLNEPKDNPHWKQDFWGSKYRAPDGSECAYECGKLKPDENNNYTFNYEPDPFVHDWVLIPSPRHVFYDVLPHFICGPIVSGQTKRY